MKKRVVLSIVGICLGLGLVAGGGFYWRGREERLLKQAFEAYYNEAYDVAIPLFNRLMEDGNLIAQAVLGDCYLKGFGVEESLEKAVALLRAPAESGDAQAQASLAACYIALEKPDDECLYWLQLAADQGHSKANLTLGKIYASGSFGEQSNEKAFYYFSNAAEIGDADAQYHLAICYDDGLGVEQSEAQAIAWYEKAAEQNFVDAQFILGSHHLRNGNYDEGFKWTQKAAEQGSLSAQINLAKCYKWGHGVAQSNEEAIKWTRKAAEQGDVEARYNLAYCYAEGVGVEQSMDEAFKLWNAIDEAYANDLETGTSTVPLDFAIPTMYNIGLCYLNGDGVKQNPISAYVYIRGAAKAGHARAQQLLKEVWNEEATDPLVTEEDIQTVLQQQESPNQPDDDASGATTP